MPPSVAVSWTLQRHRMPVFVASPHMLELIDRALAEDLGEGDLTSAAVVAEGARARARIEQRAAGVLAGLRVAKAVFERVDPDLRWRPHAAEEEWREPGLLAEVVGD